MDTATGTSTSPHLQTLPGDEIRQLQWRYAERYDLQMLVQSVRNVARGPVARLVAAGARNSHEWTEEKASLLSAFDESGLTAMFADPQHGGFLEGPRNLAMALSAFELAWVDGGAATCSMASHLGLAPIHEKGTKEQIDAYMGRAVPQGGQPPLRAAFALTEPLPYVGVDTGVLSGKARVVEWPEGGEPVLQIEKRGRFITNMDFADVVTAAVESDDPRIKGSFLVILEKDDPGTFDRGAPTLKLVHQLSSTRDPIFNLKIPASRIVGGYEVQDGVIVPHHNHGKVIEAVFRRTRVPVGLMTAAKLLSAIEPIIRYQRGRFRGGAGDPGTPRYELGLQQKEDVLQRLVEIWATGEAAASLGFATARLFDHFDPLEKRKDEILGAQGALGGRTEMRAMQKVQKEAVELLDLRAKDEAQRDADRFAALQQDELVQYALAEAEASVLCPATKLWNTGHGANVMREAVSLVGGYGITEDCPGFLGQKWMDAQLEATYEGPEAVQRRQLSVTMTNPVFLRLFEGWTVEQRELADQHAGLGACTLGTAMQMWTWTLKHLRGHDDADGKKLYQSNRQGVTFLMADALCWLLASRQQMLDVLHLEQQTDAHPELAEALPGTVAFLSDLSRLQAARAAGEVGRICAELVFGYQRHPTWESCGSCYQAGELEALEGLIPGIESVARDHDDVVEADGSHPHKQGPCVKFQGLEAFTALRRKLDGCLVESHLAKDRAAQAVAGVMIPEALDYPV